MTKNQYEEYKKLNDEIENLKLFLFYCSKKYQYHMFYTYYLFSLIPIKKFSKHFKLRIKDITRRENDKTFDISKDLHDRIINVIEEYVDEKEKELEEL